MTADSEAQTRHVTLHSSISSCGSSIDNRRRHIHLSRTDEPGGRSEGGVQCPPLIVGRCVNAHTFDKLGVVVRTTAGAVKAIAITHHRPRRVRLRSVDARGAHVIRRPRTPHSSAVYTAKRR